MTGGNFADICLDAAEALEERFGVITAIAADGVDGEGRVAEAVRSLSRTGADSRRRRGRGAPLPAGVTRLPGTLTEAAERLPADLGVSSV